MSMVPMLFRDWWDEYDFQRPSRLLDQSFGMGMRMDDLINNMSLSSRGPSGRYLRPWRTPIVRQDSGSTITADNEKFQVILDVQQFAPKEISVKISNNSVIVEGKHEEKQDEHGFISRHFVRRYMLPSDHDINDVVSSLSSDGILTVTAPTKVQKPVVTDRVVTITQTGPAKSTVTPVDTQTTQPTVEHPQ